MNKKIKKRLMMLAVIVMASMAAFAQGSKFGANTGVVTNIGFHTAGDVFDYEALRYYVVSAGDAGLQLEVIGLAGYISGKSGEYYSDQHILADPNKVTDIYGGKITIPHKLSAADAGQNCEILSIAANAFTSTVLYPTTDGGKNETHSKNQFATAAALVTSIEILYHTEATAVASIGANAFAGLTALTQVENFTPGDKIKAINKNSFDENVYKTAPLIVPATLMGKYASKNGWKEFYIIKDSEDKILGNVNGDKKLNATDYLKLYSEIKIAMNNNTTVTYSTYKDINGDGKVNATDYQLLYNIIKLHL